MAQFDGLLPRFEYGSGSPQPLLDFNVPPRIKESFPRATTTEDEAPGADTGDSDEHVQTHLYNFDYVLIKAQHISDSDYNDFRTWRNVVRDGQTFTYYPDKDDSGTSNTVILENVDNFKPVRTNSLWYFDILLRIVA